MTTVNHPRLDLLLSQAAAGDDAAFRDFYDATSPIILAVLLRLTSDRYQAEDLLQEAMVTAWDRAGEFDASRASAMTWVTMIARRKALDMLRGQRRRKEILHDGADDIRTTLGLEQNVAATAPESSATKDRLLACFDKLQPDCAACIRFAYLEGLTFAEISDRVERSMGTVKSWVRRGLAKLKRCMQQ